MRIDSFRDRERNFFRGELSSEGVPADGDIDEPEGFLIEFGDVARGDDHPHTRPPQRHPGAHACHERLAERKTCQQSDDRRRLAARDDEPVHVVQVFEGLYARRLDAERIESGDVFVDVALEGEDADDRRSPPFRAVRHQVPRTLISWLSVS